MLIEEVACLQYASWIAVVACAVAVGAPAENPQEIYRRAAQSIQTGDPTAAIAVLEPLLQAQPNDIRALTLMGMASSAAGRLAASEDFLRHALDLRPTYAPALKAIGMNEMALGRRDLAKTHFEELLKVSSNDAVAQVGLGEIAFAEGNYRGAMERFEASGNLHLEDPRTLLDYAHASIKAGDPAKAESVLPKLPGNADAGAHFEAGALLASLKSYKAAAEQFALAQRGATDPYLVGYDLVLAHFNGGEYRPAIDAGEKLIAQGYRKAELFNLLSQAYEKAGDTKNAYDALRTATQIDPGDEANYLDLIALCVTHKNYDLALEISNVGIQRSPSSPRLRLQQGIVFAMKEQFANARSAFERAVQLAPDQSLPHVALALMLMQMNQPREATELLQRRTRASSKDYMALWFLGESLNRAGAAPGSAEQAEALDALKRSVQLNPDIAQSQILLGKLLARDGQLGQAAAHLERALTLEPGNVGAMYQLAQIYSRKGDTQRAKQLFAAVSKAKTEDREQFVSKGLQQIIREGAR